MARGRFLVLTLAASALFTASPAAAWLENGTLLTNAASATYQNYGGQTTVTYSATMRVFVANPYLFIWKDCTPTVVGSVGGLITYTLSFSNGGANTVFNVTINDKLPNGDGCWFMGLESSWSGAGIPAPSWSASGGATWAAGVPVTGQGAPVTSMILRWIVPSLGIGVSGSITFVVSIG